MCYFVVVVVSLLHIFIHREEEFFLFLLVYKCYERIRIRRRSCNKFFGISSHTAALIFETFFIFMWQMCVFCMLANNLSLTRYFSPPIRLWNFILMLHTTKTWRGLLGNFCGLNFLLHDKNENERNNGKMLWKASAINLFYACTIKCK